MRLIYLKQAWQLLKQNRLYSTVYIIGTGLAMKTQLRLGNIYLMDVTSFDDLRTNFFRSYGTINDVKTVPFGYAPNSVEVR